MPNRRYFLKTIAGSAALLGLGSLPLDLLAKYELEKITILHTNDVHSHIDPFPDNGVFVDHGGSNSLRILYTGVSAGGLNEGALDDA